MPAPNEISPTQLVRLIGLPTSPALVDISTDEDFAEDPFLIPGAFRHSHRDVNGLKTRLNGRNCIVICQKGKKLSQGLTSWLRSDGVQAEYLQGGNQGWRAMADAPRIPAQKIPEPVQGSTLWVTRQRPKIDRIACPWLIRRFVDPDARFLFVSAAEVAGVAERYGAIPFDVENTFWSHRGPQCTFDTMLDEFGLRTDALDRLSTVVRAADTNQHDQAAEAAGLLAFSVGLSRQYRDDQSQLLAGLAFYDALYRWARDGHNEAHDWPMDRPA